MSKIRIKNFGPIKEGYQDNDGWLDIKKVTIFIGNQGSGKSTVAKLISTFTWIEKALVRGDYDTEWFKQANRLKDEYLNFHRLENYFDPNTVIEYQGDVYSIKYEKDSLSIDKISEAYPLPQIMYVPAERNFISYVKSAKELRLSSESLQIFLAEFGNAKKEMEGLIRLPINNVDIEYIESNDTLLLKGENYDINLTESSSGFQSLVPLYLVSNYLANSVKKQNESKEPMNDEERTRFRKGVSEIMNNNTLTDRQKRDAVSAIASKFNKTAFVNIVEEPEQNLFPSSQWQMLQSLLGFNNMNNDNKLIMTTHSPYIINFLSIAIQGDYLKKKIAHSSNSSALFSELNEVVPEKSLVSSEDVVVYQLDENDGSIHKLQASMGIPSDRNYLNNMLREGNRMFDSLLEIEEKLQL